MADYRRIARQKARKYGLNPDVFERQIDAESRFNPRARSRAGAQGIAQIMPGTARSWGVDPNDPIASLDAAAKNMARYVRQFGSYEKALRAYNAGPGNVERSRGFAETNAYVKKILRGGDPGGLSRPQSQDAGQTPASPGRVNAIGYKTTDKRGAVLDALLNRKPGQSLARGIIRNLQSGDYDSIETATQVTPGQSTPSSTATGRDGGSALQPGGGFAGTTNIVEELARLGHKYGLVTTSGKRQTQMTASGNVSDHWIGNKTSNARDISGTVGQMDQAAVAIARRLGIPYKKGQRLEATVTKGGYRYQVLYRTNTGGNHYNHIHVGVRKL